MTCFDFCDDFVVFKIRQDLIQLLQLSVFESDELSFPDPRPRVPPCPGGSIERRPKKNEKKSPIVTGQETQFGPINDVGGAPTTAT